MQSEPATCAAGSEALRSKVSLRVSPTAPPGAGGNVSWRQRPAQSAFVDKRKDRRQGFVDGLADGPTGRFFVCALSAFRRASRDNFLVATDCTCQFFCYNDMQEYFVWRDCRWNSAGTAPGRWSRPPAWASASRLPTANPCMSAPNIRWQATSAESNVVSISAGLGLPVKVLTTFVKGSPIAAFIKGDLARRGIAYEGAEVEQGRPVGLPPPVQHRRQRLWHARAARGERPRGRGGAHAPRQGFRFGQAVCQGRGADSAPFGPDCRAPSPETGEFCLRLGGGRQGGGHARIV